MSIMHHAGLMDKTCLLWWFVGMIVPTAGIEVCNQQRDETITPTPITAKSIPTTFASKVHH